MQIFMPLNILGFVYREIRGSMANIDNMFALLDTRSSVQDEDNVPPLNITRGEICFENVSFSYRDDRPILKNISFTIKPGEKVAIVGASGAGKSTLVKLLFRFYDTNSGRILIDGQDIRKVSQQSLREKLGIVPQDTVLFNDTLLENIRYGNPDASEPDIEQAIRTAHLDSFIAQLPEKGETRVGERGLKLSGGEKQRVAIARAVLKNPPVLLFDEATSSLDSGAERAIMEALSDLASGHTTIMIAHRLSTITDAGNILVLKQGELAEQGTHQELLMQQGEYARLWTLQQKQEN